MTTVARTARATVAVGGQSRGFSLIELLIVIAIVGILSAIAIPAYTHYITGTRRAAAEACLANFASYMERYHATNMDYSLAALPTLGCASAQNTGDHYGYSLADDSATAYTLQAKPTGVQATRDAQCGNLSITQSGQRGASGSAGVAGCWSH